MQDSEETLDEALKEELDHVLNLKAIAEMMAEKDDWVQWIVSKAADPKSEFTMLELLLLQCIYEK